MTSRLPWILLFALAGLGACLSGANSDEERKARRVPCCQDGRALTCYCPPNTMCDYGIGVFFCADGTCHADAAAPGRNPCFLDAAAPREAAAGETLREAAPGETTVDRDAAAPDSGMLDAPELDAPIDI